MACFSRARLKHQSFSDGSYTCCDLYSSLLVIKGNLFVSSVEAMQSVLADWLLESRTCETC